MLIKTKQSRPLSKKRVGGKASNLNFLYLNGLLIPDSFIVPISLFESYARDGEFLNLIKELTLEKSLVDLKSRAKSIKIRILSANIDQRVIDQAQQTISEDNFKTLAVRSSINVEDGAKYSFAGQFESFLNVAAEDLEEKIKQCWASCFSDRVITYCYSNKISPSILRPAVILQQMIQAQLGGIVFTRSSMSEMMLLEVCDGNVADLTDGVAEPRRFFIHRDPSPSGQEQESKNSVNIKEISQKSLLIEKLFDCPQDIEWVQLDDSIVFLQARPLSHS